MVEFKQMTFKHDYQNTIFLCKNREYFFLTKKNVIFKPFLSRNLHKSRRITKRPPFMSS